VASVPEIAKYMEPVARALFGEPNELLSKPGQLRFGTKGSISVDLAKGEFYDFDAKNGGGVLQLLEREGYTGKAAFHFLREIGCVETPPRANGKHRPARSKRKITKTYHHDYVGPDGRLSYQVVRNEFAAPDGGKPEKSIFQRRPFGSIEERRDKQKWIVGLKAGEYIRSPNGDWFSATDAHRRQWPGAEIRRFDEAAPMLYRLPELLEEMAQPEAERRVVLLPEGEQKVDLLMSWGCIATTNMGGVNGWLPHFPEFFGGTDVVIMADNDDAGRRFAHEKAKSLRDIARRIRILDLRLFWTGCPQKGDVVDWAQVGGGTEARLWEIVEKLADWTLSMDASASRPGTSGAGWQQHVMTSKELQTMTFSPVTFVVRDLIPADGITLICAKPKVGKSWLLLDLCVSATTDRFVLGDRKCTQGDVLYLALEDSHRRLQSRMTKLLPTFTGDWPSGLTLATQWRRTNEHGLDDIREWVRSRRASGRPIAFVAIDVLKMVRPLNQGKKPAYDVDYEAVAALRNLAIELNVPIIVLHHTRKAEADDLIDKVSGTFGLVGSADTIIVIEKRTNGWVFDVRGRDVSADELAVEFNKNTCRWTILGEARAVHRSAERATVLAVFEDAGKPLTAADVTARLEESRPESHRTQTAIRQNLARMVKSGDLCRVATGKYALHPSPLSQESQVTGEDEG
jgi:AAA domain